jgi:hypothetical protein
MLDLLLPVAEFSFFHQLLPVEFRYILLTYQE